MTKIYFLIVVVCLLGFLCGCSNDDQKDNSFDDATTTKIDSFEADEETDDSKHVLVNGKKITIEEIVAQIPDTINNELYYSGNYSESNHMFLNKELILNKYLEYKLYSYYPSVFSSDSKLDTYLPEVRLVFTNLEHPLSTVEEPKLYYVTIKVTENGLQSAFFSGNYISKSETPGVFLGNYSLCIGEITTPKHEQMSDEWKEKAEKELRRYMDENDFYSIAEHNLETGNYKVYIKGFSANDTNTRIIFEHENGNVYEGFYYFVHHISGSSTANLNKVALIENINNESFKVYLDRVKQNATFYMEYMVH